MKPTNKEGAAAITTPLYGWRVDREGCPLWRATIHRGGPNTYDTSVRLFLSVGGKSHQLDVTREELADLVEGMQAVQHVIREGGKP